MIYYISRYWRTLYPISVGTDVLYILYPPLIATAPTVVSTHCKRWNIYGVTINVLLRGHRSPDRKKAYLQFFLQSFFTKTNRIFFIYETFRVCSISPSGRHESVKAWHSDTTICVTVLRSNLVMFSDYTAINVLRLYGDVLRLHTCLPAATPLPTTCLAYTSLTSIRAPTYLSPNLPRTSRWSSHQRTTLAGARPRGRTGTHWQTLLNLKRSVGGLAGCPLLWNWIW